ncbi:hypothetical protein SSTU70S_01060 [Stutzerimonas stutzeri]
MNSLKWIPVDYIPGIAGLLGLPAFKIVPTAECQRHLSACRSACSS